VDASLKQLAEESYKAEGYRLIIDLAIDHLSRGYSSIAMDVLQRAKDIPEEAASYVKAQDSVEANPGVHEVFKPILDSIFPKSARG
jgi:hypothetical protein